MSRDNNVNPDVRIGVVLSSGGTPGLFAHTGFLYALAELGIPYHTVAGCSAGAIVGGLIASGTDLSAWSSALAQARGRDLWNPDPLWQILWRVAVQRGKGYTGLSDTATLISSCRSLLGVERFEDCPVPFRALALSLDRNRKVVFSTGELAPRMVASAAAPVLYRPVEIDGELYCDGAVVELGPVDAICCNQDIDLVIVHHVATRRAGSDRLRKSLQAPWALGRIVDWIVYRQEPWYLTGEPISFHACPGGRGTTIAVVEPVLPQLPWGSTHGGVAVQQAAQQQAFDVIGSWATRLLSNPRGLVPAPTLPHNHA